MPKKRWVLQFAGLTLCAFAAAISAPAAPAAGTDTPFIVASWDNESGLPDSEVISVIQTRDGYLWLGTLHGLVRFDGNHFTLFDVMNTPGLPSDRIVYLFEDRQTNLWVSTESSGLTVIKDGIIKNFAGETVGTGRKVINAEEDASGNIWFYTPDGLLQYYDGKMSFHAGVPRASLGLLQKWEIKQNNFGPFPWDNRVVTAACEDRNGNLIVGTLGKGIFWHDTQGNWQNISTNQGLSSAFVLSLCVDREGDLWAGTDGRGLNRIKRKIFTEPAGLHPWAAQSVSADTNGGIWTAFNAAGLSRWEENHTVENFGIGLASNAWTVLVTRSSRVWAGTRDDGLFILETNGFQHAPAARVLGPQIYALFEDRAGQLWAGTQKGLANFNGANWKLFTKRDGLSENVVRAIAEDSRGNLWVGTESGGVNVIQRRKIHFLSRRHKRIARRRHLMPLRRQG